MSFHRARFQFIRRAREVLFTWVLRTMADLTSQLAVTHSNTPKLRSTIDLLPYGLDLLIRTTLLHTPHRLPLIRRRRTSNTAQISHRFRQDGRLAVLDMLGQERRRYLRICTIPQMIINIAGALQTVRFVHRYHLETSRIISHGITTHHRIITTVPLIRWLFLPWVMNLPACMSSFLWRHQGSTSLKVLMATLRRQGRIPAVIGCSQPLLSFLHPQHFLDGPM